MEINVEGAFDHLTELLKITSKFTSGVRLNTTINSKLATMSLEDDDMILVEFFKEVKPGVKIEVVKDSLATSIFVWILFGKRNYA